MKPRILIFAGTTEGRLLCEALSAAGIGAVASVATEYGREILPALPGIEVLAGRLDARSMTELIQGRSIQTVVDATHPYAVEATDNIRAACAGTGVRYIRLLRPESKYSDVATAADAGEAARLLDGEGNALITVGVKELEAFTGVRDFARRLYVRVLPSEDSMRSAMALGFSGRHLIGMQGPFTRELNVALLRMFNCRWLVTKDSGDAGGLRDKLDAARDAGAEVILIRRVRSEEGLSLAEVERLLLGRTDQGEGRDG
jgi:precorrin-6x reductase